MLPRGGSPLLVEIEGVDAAVRRDSARQRGGERAAARAGLKHDAPRDELEVGDDETDVGDVEDLGPVAEHERPELRGRRQEVHEPTAGLASAAAPLAPSTPASAAGGAEDLGSEGEADPVVVAEDAEPVLEHAAGADRDGTHRVVALVHHHRVALRDAALRGGLVRGVEGHHHCCVRRGRRQGRREVTTHERGGGGGGWGFFCRGSGKAVFGSFYQSEYLSPIKEF